MSGEVILSKEEEREERGGRRGKGGGDVGVSGAVWGEIGDQIRFVLRSVHVYVWAMADGACGLINI